MVNKSKVWKGEKCFACNKPLFSDADGLLNARMASTREGENVVVGLNCHNKASNFGIHGWQYRPNTPRIFTTMLAYCDHAEHGGGK